MKQISIPVKPDTKLNIIAADDLSVEGLEGSLMIAVFTESDSFRYTEGAGRSEIRVTSSCRLQIPPLMAVTLQKVGGDASINDLASRMIIGKVGGDLVIQNVPGASVETVGGDFSIKNSTEAVEAARVGGDLFATNIQSLSSRAVGGDVFCKQVNGKVNLIAGGDVDLSLDSPVLPPLSITAGGDIDLILPVGANGQLELHSRSQAIEVNAAGQQGEWEIEQLSLPLGEGGNVLHLEAGGDILVTDQGQFDHDFEDLFSSPIEDWRSFGARLEDQIRQTIGASMESIKWATRNASRASEKARMRAEKARRKVGSSGVTIDSTGINVDRNGRSVGFVFGTPDAPKTPPRSGATDEERLLVLRMLQEKKITAEEADKLLSALDK